LGDRWSAHCNNSGKYPNQAFIPVTHQVIESHLRGESRVPGRRGDFVAGVYALLANESCWFLVADFDGENWAPDALAYIVYWPRPWRSSAG